METAVAPIAPTIKPQTAPSLFAKPVPKPGPTESQIKLATVQKASGNLAIQRAVESEMTEPSVTDEKAPASAQEDRVHQAVAGNMQKKAKNARTPTKTPEEKRDETELAARVACRTITDTTNAHKNHLEKIEQVQPQDLTVREFMVEFESTSQKLAKTVPTSKSDEQKRAFEQGQSKAQENVAAQNKSHSDPLRTEVDKDPSQYPDNKKEEAGDYDLSPDDPGKVPEIKHAKEAAPKPEPEATVSLDDKSRELDDALRNHDVQGQTIDIDESSLAFPVSGEKSFDEAGEAKRQAQDEIAKAKPQYRDEEKGVINKSQNDIHSLVNIQGLPGHHNLRAKGFQVVLEKQVFHKGRIKSRKQTIFESFEKTYTDTKNEVDKELDSLKYPEPIEQTFENILTAADAWFSSYITQAMEYIDPGFWGRSNWAEKNGHRIAEEYKQLIGEKYNDLDVAIDKLAEKHKTLGDIAKAFRSFGGGDWGLYLQAYKKIQEVSAKEYYEIARASYIDMVKSEVATKVATRVVNALNSARSKILIGEAKLHLEFQNLSPAEQGEVADVFQGIKDRFGELRKTVDERQHEITADMARTYNKSVGKLKTKFEEIKTSVFSSWLERAWNKIKAVINAIIEFATRIVELLARMVGVVGDIISSPRAFFSNLITGISEGFSTFVDRIDEYLATAFFDWIRGTSGVRVQLPKEWDPAGIFSLFTQLLNLSTETIWQRMEIVYDKSVANAFRQGEVVLEKGLEIFDIVKREGLGGLWDYIVESLGTLLSDTLEEMKETVLYAAIKKVFIEIGKMLIPGGGFIAIAEKIIRLVMFIVEARNKILDLIESFIASMEDAVKGDIAGIVKRVTTALTKFITVALDFLVAFFGLSDLKAKVERFIERMRNPIIKGIDFVLKKFKPLVMKGKELVVKGKEKVVGAGKRIVSAVRRWLGLEKKFVANDGMEHKFYFGGSEANPILMIRSHPSPFGTFIESVEVGSDEKKIEAKASALSIARKIDAKRLEPLEGATEDDKERSKEEKVLAVAKLLDDLAVPAKLLFGELLAIGEPHIVNTPQAAGYGQNMTALRLNKQQKVKGKRPTTSMNSSFAILNRRREQGNPETAYYMKGHLLSQDVGGSSAWANLTPLSRKGNSDHESQVESLVKAAFQSGAVVEYNVTATYGYGQNEGRIPADDPKASEKKRIIQEEVNVPTNLACEAFVMDKLENGGFGRKQTIVKAEVPNPIGQDAASYAFSDSPVRDIIYLNDPKPENENKIATIEGVDSTMAWKIVLAHKELRNSSRFNSYEELSDARDFAHDRIFPTRPEQEQVLALKKVKYVKLYEGEGGRIAAGTEADIPEVLTN